MLSSNKRYTHKKILLVWMILITFLFELHIGRPCFVTLLGKTQIKFFFLVVGPLRFFPPYTNDLVVHASFFSFFSYYSLKRILPFFLHFWAKKAGFIERKKIIF